MNSKREIQYGTLVSSLTLSGENTVRPDNHVIYFIGEHPCNRDGSPIQAIIHNTGNQTLDAKNNLTVNHSFSNKPANGFNDYYEKVTSYIRVISCQAVAINPDVTACTFKPIAAVEENSVFKYLDTNSSNAEIETISQKLEKQIIAIVGSGGTGSYILDYVAKTQVAKIHLFDGDDLLSHNAFREPGAASLDELNSKPKKVNHLHAIYSRMRNFVIPHAYNIISSNLAELSGMNFVFLCVDDGEAKRPIIDYLLSNKIPFVDVGMGVQVVNGALTGSVRVTTVTEAKFGHVGTRISFGTGGNNDYAKNIQIAELNALNAALAVIKWKKMAGFYYDLEKEHHAVYHINLNEIVNEETHP